MNSREKGKRGERQWRDELRQNGYAARRGQQFSGSAESPDVICEELAWIHFEVKAVERLNIEDAMDQARRDGVGKTAIVSHKRNFRPWLVTMDAQTFFKFLRGVLPPDVLQRSTLPQPSDFPSPPQDGVPQVESRFPARGPQSGEGEEIRAAVDSKQFETVQADVASESSSKTETEQTKTKKETENENQS